MATGVDDQELVDRFEEFFRDYYQDEIGDLARNYPSEQRSLTVDWQDLFRFDTDLADDYIDRPEQLQRCAEEALRLYDLPVDVKLGQAHVRITNLPETTPIREIRARHVNTLVSVSGIVRKATDVRPKVQTAAFQCQRCESLTQVPQTGSDFQEPHECRNCERQGPFRLNFDQSEFVDAQRLRIQESPEGLRGGETPQSIDVDIEDDITGEVTPGDRVTATGILRLDQGGEGDSSPVFDVFMEGVSVDVEDEQFEDMDITEADKREIIERSNEDDLYEQMIDAMAPSIHGYREEKLAMVLQLFSGVTKELPDGSRIRGDLHMLLIGDPGTGKCVAGETLVTLADGTEVPIRELVETNLDDPKPVDDGVYDDVEIDVLSMDDEGKIEPRAATKVWKREVPDRMYRIKTSSGTEIEVTPSHPLFVHSETGFEAVRSEALDTGDQIAVPRRLNTDCENTIDIEYRRSKANNAVHVDLPGKWTPSLARLVGYIVAEGYVDIDEANSGSIVITNTDDEILADIASGLEQLGLPYTERSPYEAKSARDIACSASGLATFLANLDPALLEASSQQRVPLAIKRAGSAVRNAFLKAYVDSEGTVSTEEREITVASMSDDLLRDVRSLLLSSGIRSQIHPRKNGSWRLRISGRDFERYRDEIGFVTERKSAAASAHEINEANTNQDCIPIAPDELRSIRESLCLPQDACGIPRTTYQHYERGDRLPSRRALGLVITAFEERIEWLTAAKRRVQEGGWETIEKVRSELDVSQAVLANEMGVAQTAVSYYERNGATPDDGQITEAKQEVLDRISEALEVQDNIDRLRSVLNSDIGWEQITSIEPVDPEYDWVYDLEVPGTHSYLSDNVVSHNSQMLQYIRNIAPRSVYTSGKGSSSAGLCVTGDTLVQTEGGLRRIEDIVEPKLPDPVTEETAVETDVRLATFDRESGSIEERSASKAWRMPEKPCRRIETAHGKELEASVNTPVLVCGQKGIEWRQISEIELGDHVAVPRFAELNREELPVRDLLELTTEKVRLSNESIAFLRETLTDEFGTLRDAAAALDLSEDFVYLHLKNRHVPLEKLDRILDAVDATREAVSFDRLMVRHGNSITVPSTFDEDLMYLLGLVFGDGDIALDRRDGNRGMVRISNGHETLLETAADIFESKFDVRPEIERQDDRVPCIRVHNVTIARLFANAGMTTPKTDLALAPELTTAAHADAFLRGLMDADGSVSVRDSGGSSVLLSTISDDLADQVQLILETYGIRASVRERERCGTYELDDGRTIEPNHPQQFVELYGADIDRYAGGIGFNLDSKQAALDEISGQSRRQRERLPIAGVLATVNGSAGRYYQNVYQGDNPSRTRARSMLDDIDLDPVTEAVRESVDADLRWDEVTDAVDTGRKEVFDLTVPETHNFVANGVITHNTAAAVRDDFGDGQQWTLEAGALVLADQGVAAVDELDKMRCVTGDTLVHLADGRIKRIGDIAREGAEQGTVETLSNGRTIRDVDLTAWSMDEDGSLTRKPVTAIHEYEAPERLTRVALSTGETVTATDDHPFFVLQDGDRVEKPASELDDGDWVYVPRSVPTTASDGGSTVVRDDSGASGENGTSAPDDPCPALGAVVGYLSGDGNVFYNRSQGSYGIRFTNAEEELRQDFERACRRAFDAEPTRPPSEQRADGVETVRLSGREYADAVLGRGMNLETYDGKAFPDGVADGPPETKAAFIRALADSEGTVDTATGNVRIYSSSHELLLGTKSLLLEFGVDSQIRTETRDENRDLHVLSITDADALDAYARHVGFTLDRKASALESVVESVSGDRTILDVVPDIGHVLRQHRERLRLYQRECGLDSSTYCNFENGHANVSLHRARRILEAFEARKQEADADHQALASGASWEQLSKLTDRYHVSQSELAETIPFRQQEISRKWGTDETLREDVRTRLQEITAIVAETDLTSLRDLVRGDVKWRQVDTVESISPRKDDDRIPVLREELADLLGCAPEDAVEAARRRLNSDPDLKSWDQIRTELDRYGVSFQSLAEDLGVAGSTVSRWFDGSVETDSLGVIRSAATSRIQDVRSEIARLVDEIEARQTPCVYDLTVEDSHNFVANGMVVHNSEDRSAMHEALEQQSISVSKAGINATLKSRCSLLGAANPKYGRFDQYEPIGEQIDLEPALISRFDLIFTVTDQPDEEEDAALAEHILTTNYAGELNTQREEMASPDVSREEVESIQEDVEPAIEPELLRKYVAYAQQNCHPRMSDAARQEIRDFYVDLRSKGTDEDAPVPVTARKLEALVRLAEASARVRLSDEVTREDAQRVIDIVRSCLQDIGVDPETGQFDADVVETGQSKSQRDRIKNLKGLIEELEDEYEEGVPKEKLIEEADQIGMDPADAEAEIEKLKEKGDIYEPQSGYIRNI